MAEKFYRIHPGIGVARLGNHLTEYFIGPEAPGVIPLEGEGPYKQDGKIKRQGARFRIYEYERDTQSNERVVREITNEEADIEWRVHLVNKKAEANQFPPDDIPQRRNLDVVEDDRGKLIIDAGNQSINSNGSQPTVLTGGFLKDYEGNPGVEVTLGEILVDRKGHLIVLGGVGNSGSVPPGQSLGSYANNDRWHDDVSDGPVTAVVRLKNNGGTGAEPSVDSAWIVVAPPSYAPAIDNMITVHDEALNVAVQKGWIEKTSPVLFTKHIYPILRRTVFLQWVSDPALRGHGNNTRGDFLDLATLKKLANPSSDYASDRQNVFRRLGVPGKSKDMPQLDEGLEPENPTNQEFPSTLTSYQYELMEQWKNGQFNDDWEDKTKLPLPDTTPFDQIPVTSQPAALDRAALEACVAVPFHPGIEMGYLIARRNSYRAPFRLKLPDDSTGSELDFTGNPGDLTAGMAVPWQADFQACGQGWWPAQRPNWVLRNNSRGPWVPGWDYQEMVDNWYKLGFILKDGDQYVDKERTTDSQGSSGESDSPTWDNTIKKDLSGYNVTHMKQISGGNLDLSDYQNVVNNVKKIYAYVSTGKMPPGAPWSSEKISTFVRWMELGCPES